MKQSCATAAIIALYATAAVAGPPPEPVSSPEAAASAAPSSARETCADCHGGLAKRKNVHPALDGGECTDCHAPRERGRCRSRTSRGWKLTAPAPELCAGCHDTAALVAKSKVPHAPVVQGRCVDCHDAHSTEAPHLLRRAGSDLCLRCHDARGPGEAKTRIDRKKAAVHAALDQGCDACHDVAHGGSAPKFLKEPEPALCYECHDRKDATKSVHSAVSGGACTDCHDPHATEEPGLLKRPRGRLCLDCHDADKLVSKEFEHAPAAEGRCLGCHDPHGSALPNALRGTGNAFCLGCHGAKAPSGKGAPGQDARIDVGKKVVHGALEVAACEDCHDAGHASDREHLLKAPAPQLCAQCHDRKDGGRYAHGAVRVGDCATCHEPHASDAPKLLRRAVGQGLCFRCHFDDISRRKVIHQPVATGKCTECHDAHSAPGRKLLKAGSGPKACARCHEAVEHGTSRHAALRRYGCTGCHDPHGAANRFLLPKPVNAVCATCHQGQATGEHVMKGFGGKHPIDKKDDPRRDGHELSCASCHDPHGSDHPLLFRSGDRNATMCDGCHGDISGKNPGGKDLVRRARTSTGSGSPGPQ